MKFLEVNELNGSGYSTLLNTRFITKIYKSERAHDTVTVIEMKNGECIKVSDSLKTLDARLSL